jgi:hypothetical protein
MLGQVLWQEDILAERLGIAASALVFRKDVNRKRAIDYDGLILGVLVKHHPTAEAANAWLSRLAEHSIGPNIH